MMRLIALSVGAVVAIAAGFNATVYATSQGTEKTNNSKKTSQTKTLEKREDGHTLTQKWLKVSEKGKFAFYHFNEIKDTDQDLYQETSKEDRHYHEVSKTNVEVDGKEQTTKRVVVYNINKNKTICNIVEHSKTGVTKDGDCSEIKKVEQPKKDDCKDEEKDIPTQVVPNTDGDEPKVEEPKEEPTEQPKVVVKDNQDKTPVAVQATDEGKGGPTPEVLPNTGASPINGTVIALFAAIATFIGYASSLALMEYRIKNQY